MNPFSKTRKTPKALPLDPRTFRDTKNSISDQQQKAKFVFLKPGKNGICEVTTYYRSMTLFQKLKHCKDFKTTTQYLKNAASGHANSSDRKVKAAAEFVLSKNNKNLAKVTPASEQAITTLAMAEGATQGAATMRKRAIAIGNTPKAHRAQLDKLKKKLTQAPAHQTAANKAAVAPLELQQERDFAANVAETNRVIAALDSPGDFADTVEKTNFLMDELESLLKD